MRCFLALVLLTTLHAGEVWHPPVDLTPRLREVLSDAVAHGLPDFSTGVLCIGELRVTGINPVMTYDQTMFDYGNPGRNMKTGTVSFMGAHLRLPDGSWVINNEILVFPSDGYHIDPNVSEWHASKEPAEPIYSFAKDPELRSVIDPSLAAWLDDQRQIHTIPQRWNGVGSSQSAVFLAKAIPGAENYIASNACIHAIQLRIPLTHPLQLRLFSDRILDAQNDLQPVEQRIRDIRPIGWSDLDSITALRRGILYCWLGRAMRGHGVGPALTEARRLSLLLPGDPMVPDVEEINHIEQALTLVPPAKTEDLATKLIGWAPVAARGLDRSKPLPASDFTPADLPSLARLVGDHRPSQWIQREIIESGRPRARSLGDNALRAMADVLHLDPRWLVGIDPAQPWDDEARSRCATALTNLFAEGSLPDPARLIASAVPRLRCRDLAYALSGLEPKSRTPVIDAIAAAWATPPNVGQSPDHDDFVVVLGLAGPHQKLQAAVTAWGETSGNLPACALYLANNGDGSLLDRLAAKVPNAVAQDLSAVRANPSPDYILREILIALGAHPTPARLDAVLGWCASDWRQRLRVISNTGIAWSGSIKMLAGGKNEGFTSLVPGFRLSEARPSWPTPPAADLTNEAVVLAVIAQALSDKSEIPGAAISRDNDGDVVIDGVDTFVLAATEGSKNQQKAAPDGSPALDVRVCDIAAVIITRWPYEVRWLEGDDGGNPTFDLRRPRVGRDAVLDGWRHEVIKRATSAFQKARLRIDRLPAMPKDEVNF